MAQTGRTRAESAETEALPPGAKAAHEIANGKKPSDEQARAALSWLLAAAQDPEAPETITVDVNLGTDAKPDVYEWMMRVLDEDEIQTAQERTQPNRAQRRLGSVDEAARLAAYVCHLVAMATVKPDLDEFVRQGGGNIVDPVRARYEALRQTVGKRRPGVIDNLAQILLEQAGYSPDAVRVKDDVPLRAARG